MAVMKDEDGKLIYRHRGETLTVEAWTHNSFRIRSVLGDSFRSDDDVPQALLPLTDSKGAEVSIEPGFATIVNGSLEARIIRGIAKDDKTDKHTGQIIFTNLETGKIVLEEYLFQTKFHEQARELFQTEGGLFEVNVGFKSNPSEKLYGMGQHHNGMLNQKGCMIDMRQRNRDVTVPFVISNRGYGLLWNMPGIGRFTSSMELTRWESYGAYQLDYWVTIGDSPAEILANYMAAAGKPGKFPEWAAGFWQCKLRYLTQEELLNVAREYKRRNLPISVIVIDYFHWSAQGDWDFDKTAWPDPDAMMRELSAMNIKVMVSVWPTVSTYSRNFEELEEKGLLVRGRDGSPALFPFYEVGRESIQYVHYMDSTNPEARNYIWNEVRRNYLSRGIDIYWLDACEPESAYGKTEEFMFHKGPGAAVANAYPMLYERGFWENMRAAGIEAPLNLCRSAWAGSQRYGTAVWSGDIPSTFGSLRRQIRSGLNMAMSGIPWWTTDIGGFTGGDIDDPEFRELLVRWFAYGVFCPIFRLHGVRRRSGENSMTVGSGADNEVWSFGDDNYPILVRYMHLREAMRPYLRKQFEICSRDGTPPMRPLFFDYPGDENCWNVDDQFFLGPDYLIAPVDQAGIERRDVYLPSGSPWTLAWTGERWDGGRSVTVEAPLDRIPFFIREGGVNPLKLMEDKE